MPLSITDQKLGEGSFGVVYLGCLNGQRVACKVPSEKNDPDFFEEIKNMQRFNHPNIVKILSYCTSPQFFAMEYMNKGSLINYFKNRNGILSKELWKISLDIAEGMKYLSSNNFVHRDLAARNCLVSGDSNGNVIVKVSDFGLLNRMKPKQKTYRNYVVTQGSIMFQDKNTVIPVRWSAPEVLLDRKFSIKSDVWSYGVVLWETSTLCKKHPYGDGHVCINGLYNYLKERKRLELPANFPEKFYKIVNTCWKFDPNNRPSFDSICSDIRTNVYVTIISK